MFEYVARVDRRERGTTIGFVVQEAVSSFHKSGAMHRIVGENVGECSNVRKSTDIKADRDFFPRRDLFRRECALEAVPATAS